MPWDGHSFCTMPHSLSDPSPKVTFSLGRMGQCIWWASRESSRAGDVVRIGSAG